MDMELDGLIGEEGKPPPASRTTRSRRATDAKLDATHRPHRSVQFTHGPRPH
jgi:hypothetical protein